VRNVSLIIACPFLVLGFAASPGTAAAQAVPVTNIEIRMVKTSTRPPLRVTAETRNPNDFAVRDVEVDCTIKDRAGNDLATYTSTIYGVFQPNQHTTTRNLNIGAWPEQGFASLCISKRAMRVTPAGAPTAEPPPPAPAPAPAPAAEQPSPAPSAAPPPVQQDALPPAAPSQ
jgi:hypothetical protein